MDQVKYLAAYIRIKGRQRVGLEAGRFCLHHLKWLQIGNTKLRVLNIPLDMQAKFLALARFNTKNNVETCGILSGKLVCAQSSMYIDNDIVC